LRDQLVLEIVRHIEVSDTINNCEDGTMHEATPETTRGTAEDEVLALHRRLLDAWGAGDAEAFAAPFRDDAVFVAFDGSVLRGRAQIAAVQRELFARWLKGSRLVDERTVVRFAGADTAIVHSAGGTVLRGKTRPAPERDSIQTLVAVRDAAGWSFVSFQNTRIRPIAAGGISALLWLLPDKLWRLLFRATKTVPRATAQLDRR
jgi:uncharacterized protein (TIGR02246 family)